MRRAVTRRPPLGEGRWTTIGALLMTPSVRHPGICGTLPARRDGSADKAEQRGRHRDPSWRPGAYGRRAAAAVPQDAVRQPPNPGRPDRPPPPREQHRRPGSLPAPLACVGEGPGAAVGERTGQPAGGERRAAGWPLQGASPPSGGSLAAELPWKGRRPRPSHKGRPRGSSINSCPLSVEMAV